MLPEEKLEFHRYASNHNLPLKLSVSEMRTRYFEMHYKQMHREIFIHIPRVLR